MTELAGVVSADARTATLHVRETTHPAQSTLTANTFQTKVVIAAFVVIGAIVAALAAEPADAIVIAETPVTALAVRRTSD